MNLINKHKDIPVNDYRNLFNWRDSFQDTLTFDFITKELSIFSRVAPPKNSCCFGNIINASLLITVLNKLINIAGVNFVSCPYKIVSLEFEFIKPVYVEDIMKAEARICKQEESGDDFIKAFIHNEDGDLCVVCRAFMMFNP